MTCNIDYAIRQICSNEYMYFLKKRNVRGIGLGYKIKNGFITCNKAICVFVTHKVSKDELSKDNIIPSLYKNIPTDVVETGTMTSSILNARIRPVLCGYSIGTAIEPSGGTLGCLVTDGKYYHVLSCNHTIANCNTFHIGGAILQPSIKDGGKNPDDVIAHLSKYIPLQYITPFKTPENFVDCAMALVFKRSFVSTKLYALGRIKGLGTPSLLQNVQKVGRTTDLTTGEIMYLNASQKLDYPNGTCLFKNQIITTPMSDKGDSGSILLDHNMLALGILNGDSTSYSVFNPINLVLKSLNVSLVTG